MVLLSLLPFRFKYVSSQPLSSMRVVVVGPQSAGKTALVAKLRGEGFASKSPTKGLEVCPFADHSCAYNCSQRCAYCPAFV